MKPKKRSPILPLLTAVLITAALSYRYGEQWLRSVLLYLSTAVWARDLVSNLSLARRVSHRFVAGETIADAIATTRQLNQKGMMVTVDYLGESVHEAHEAIDACQQILFLLDHIEQTGVQANVSVKLSQLGVKIDPNLARENMRAILSRARQYHNKVRIDMEESALVDTTLQLYRALRDEDGFDNVGVVIQAYLYRSQADVTQLIQEGAWIRLCKGAYAEPPEVAYPVKADTDANYVQLMHCLLSESARQQGVYVGLATHDEEMIRATIAYTDAHHIAPDQFEFQMLYGIRRELQETIVQSGYQMRIYVPYGQAWYPYFVRRLAERPANLWFFVNNLLRA